MNMEENVLLFLGLFLQFQAELTKDNKHNLINRMIEIKNYLVQDWVSLFLNLNLTFVNSVFSMQKQIDFVSFQLFLTTIWRK